MNKTKISKQFTGTPNLPKVKIFDIYELAEIIMVSEHKDPIFIVF